jgi:hypothetical protein
LQFSLQEASSETFEYTLVHMERRTHRAWNLSYKAHDSHSGR